MSNEWAIKPRIVKITAITLERLRGKKPRAVNGNGTHIAANEWRKIMRYFDVEEIPIWVWHLKPNKGKALTNFQEGCSILPQSICLNTTEALCEFSQEVN